MFDLEEGQVISYLDDEEDPAFYLDDSQADFIFWSKLPFWTLEEGVALLLDKDPKLVTWDLMREYFVDNKPSPNFTHAYDDLRNLSLRSLKLKEIEEEVPPVVFIEWAKAKGLSIPEQLLQAVEEREDAKRKRQTQEELEKLLKEATETLREQDKKIQALEEALRASQSRVTELKGAQWEGFDEKAKTYSKELAIAVRAYDAISKTYHKKRSIKQQISEWLRQHHPTLVNEERDRIEKICNWQKTGGLPF